MPHISVIIPAYNEESRLLPTLQSVHAYLQLRGKPFEILVVSDGSQDRTADVVNEFARRHENVRLISYSPNRGKGFAVRTGVLSALGDYVLINDADGSSPIEEIERLESAIVRGADIAIGSRNMPQADTKVLARKHRKHIGNFFNLIVQSLLVPGIKDTQCGFKLFKQHAAREVFMLSTQNGFAFDVEILFLSRRMGYRTVEVAINWHNVDGSKVEIIRDSTKMLFEVLGITVRACRGRYKFAGRNVKARSTPLERSKAVHPR